MASTCCLSASAGGCVLALGLGVGVVDGRLGLGVRANVVALPRRRRWGSMVVCMAPEEEKKTRRSPLDFPIEWERPKPGRRPDILPKFSPMKTPLPPPLPADDPPDEDEEEEEEERKEEEEENPDKEEEEEDDDPNKPSE